MKILIAGDSFAADWTVKFPEKQGWPNLLAAHYQINNIAQAGVSEYKIYKQIMSLSDVDQYDIFIISHTSPYRSVTRYHPVHHNDTLHQHADLILSDIGYHASKIKNFFNLSLRAAQGYINYHYDEEYHETSYNLFKKEIDNILPAKKTIVINNFLNQPNVNTEQHFLDFKEIQKTHPGLINHLSDQGNFILFETIRNKIIELT